MSYFRELMKKADMAKQFSIAEQSTVYFDVLLKDYPNDGMVHLRLGETYQALGDKENAAKEYKLAMKLFPMPQWKNNAELSLQQLGIIEEKSETELLDKEIKYKNFVGYPFKEHEDSILKDINNEDVIF